MGYFDANPSFVYQIIREIAEISGYYVSVDNKPSLKDADPNQKALDPRYSSRRLKEIEYHDEKATTYTIAVHDPSHRFVADGFVHKNTCADVMRLVLIKLHEKFFSKGCEDYLRFVGSVHDEIDFAIHKDSLNDLLPQLQDIMTVTLPGTDLPLTTVAEIGYSYGDAVPFKLEGGKWIPDFI